MNCPLRDHARSGIRIMLPNERSKVKDAKIPKSFSALTLSHMVRFKHNNKME